MKFNQASQRQVEAARKFGKKYGVSVSQAVKYLEECFQHVRGEISDAELYEATRWFSLKPTAKTAEYVVPTLTEVDLWEFHATTLPAEIEAAQRMAAVPVAAPVKPAMNTGAIDMKITANTSLKVIENAVMDDFNVVIDNDDAKEIRDAKRTGCLVWTAQHLVLTSGKYIERISDGQIKARNGAVYTSKEWNA